MATIVDNVENEVCEQLAELDLNKDEILKKAEQIDKDIRAGVSENITILRILWHAKLQYPHFAHKTHFLYIFIPEVCNNPTTIR